MKRCICLHRNEDDICQDVFGRQDYQIGTMTPGCKQGLNTLLHYVVVWQKTDIPRHLAMPHHCPRLQWKTQRGSEVGVIMGQRQKTLAHNYTNFWSCVVQTAVCDSQLRTLYKRNNRRQINDELLKNHNDTRLIGDM